MVIIVTVDPRRLGNWNCYLHFKNYLFTSHISFIKRRTDKIGSLIFKSINVIGLKFNSFSNCVFSLVDNINCCGVFMFNWSDRLNDVISTSSVYAILW